MPQVHTFTLLEDLHDDTRLPLQYLGGGASPAARQVELSLLLAWIEANIAFPTQVTAVASASISAGGGSVAVPGGRILTRLLVTSSGHDEFQLGTTNGGSELVEDGQSSTSGEVYVLERYFGSNTTIYFTGNSGTLTVKLVYINVS